MTIFVMHIHRQLCTGCGRGETLSHLYQAEEATRGQKLLPCHSISPLDPVRRIELPVRHIPICEGCVDESRANIGAEVYANWQETLKRKYSTPAPVGAARTPTAHAPKPEPTLDDLA